MKLLFSSLYNDGIPNNGPRRINAGGTADLTELAGNKWLKDRPHMAGDYGYVGGAVKNAGSMPIAGTNDDFMYQTERYWTATTAAGYRFAVPNGTCRVELRFAETQYNAAGKRKFSVK